ncbi:hypothetical protein C1H46_023329 [Malus baccata]|uniref:Large ribosomal subunit protein uL6 N-terminal domain-containing protein n=1 Tax=Malus baccata TaxID=106549 RepID=A0A540LX65_MALBA|nr:hypothetical protein C1H46_023329 [Malus baccata]
MAAKARNLRKTRNPDLVHEVGKFSRSKMYHKRGLWAIKAKNYRVFPSHDPKQGAETSHPCRLGRRRQMLSLHWLRGVLEPRD